MKILVTGGAGYLGSVLCPLLVSQGHDVTALDNFMYRQSPLLHCPGARIVRHDVRQRVSVDGYDAVIPLAAIVGAPACDRDTVSANAINFVAIQDMDLRGKMVIYPNTNSGYGRGDFCTEETPLNPLSHYARTKQAAEEEILKAGGISLRLATLFGCSPRMRLDLMVNDFVYRAVHDRAITLFEPHYRRNFLHVRDAAHAFAHALNNFDAMCGEAYNVGDSRVNITKAQLCERIAQHTEFTWNVAQGKTDPDRRDYVVSNAKIEASGWRPRHTLESGILELINAYQMPVTGSNV